VIARVSLPACSDSRWIDLLYRGQKAWPWTTGLLRFTKALQYWTIWPASCCSAGVNVAAIGVPLSKLGHR